MAFDRYGTTRGIMVSASQPDDHVRACLFGSFDGRTGSAEIIIPLPDNKHVVMMAYGDTEVAVWRIEDQSLARLLAPEHSGAITNVVCDPAGNWMVIGVEKVGIYVYSIHSVLGDGEPVGFLSADTVGSWFSFAFMGQSLYVSSQNDGTIQEWSGLPDALHLVSTWTPPAPPIGKYLIADTVFLAVDAPRKRLACQLPFLIEETRTHNMTVLHWCESAGYQFEAEMVVSWGRQSPRVAFSSDGAWLAVAEYEGAESAYPVRLIPLGSDVEASFYPPDGIVSALKFSPDGRYLAVGGVNGAIEIRSAADWHLHSRFLAHPYGWDWRGGPPNNALVGLEWTPDSRYLLSAGGSGSTYDVKTGWNSGPADYSVKVWEIKWFDRMARRREQSSAT